MSRPWKGSSKTDRKKKVNSNIEKAKIPEGQLEPHFGADSLQKDARECQSASESFADDSHPLRCQWCFGLLFLAIKTGGRMHDTRCICQEGNKQASEQHTNFREK